MVRSAQLTRALRFGFDGRDLIGYCRCCERHLSCGPHDLDLTVIRNGPQLPFWRLPNSNQNDGHGRIRDERLGLRRGSERSERHNTSGSFTEESTAEITCCLRTVRTAQHIRPVYCESDGRAKKRRKELFADVTRMSCRRMGIRR